MVRTTSTSPILTTSGSGGWMERGPSPPSQASGRAVTAEMAFRRSSPVFTTPQGWRWTARATSTSPIPATTESGGWMERGPSPPSREPGQEETAGDGGPAIEAQLSSPKGVAVDGAGNLYIADTFNHQVRRVDPEGIITTVTSFPTVYIPRGVAVDGAGNLYIADSGNHRIRRVDGARAITTVAGTGTRGNSGDGGPAIEAQLSSPRGVAVDGEGNLYIADTSNNRIRRVDGSGIITTVAGSGNGRYSAGTGPAVEATLHRPNGVAVDSAGSFYIVDRLNNAIRRVDGSGIITTIAGSGEERLQWRRWPGGGSGIALAQRRGRGQLGPCLCGRYREPPHSSLNSATRGSRPPDGNSSFFLPDQTELAGQQYQREGFQDRAPGLRDARLG